MSEDLCVSMEIPPDVTFAYPLATMAKSLAERNGMGQRESYRFQLTVEEFCLCLAGLAERGQPLHIALTGKRHQLHAAFTFKAADLALGALNINSCATSKTPTASAEELGLLLAAKTADRFYLKHLGTERFLLVTEVDRAYPEAVPVHLPEGSHPPYAIRASQDPALLSQAAALAMATYPAWQCPLCFRTPGKFADMVAEGQYACVVACDAKGMTVGLLAWSPCSEQALFFSGPFVFAPRQEAPNVARLLVDGFLEAVARSHYTIVLSFRATADLPHASFESLGTLQQWDDDGHVKHHPVLFRLLGEDNGLAVWSSPRMETFLHQTYDRLALARDILPVEDPLGRRRHESLLGATFDQVRNLGELKPFLDGEDMVANLEAHVAAFRMKGIGKILFYMDLSAPWEAALAGDLIEAGFAPKVLLPQGGQADLVVWQYAQTA